MCMRGDDKNLGESFVLGSQVNYVDSIFRFKNAFSSNLKEYLTEKRTKILERDEVQTCQ